MAKTKQKDLADRLHVSGLRRKVADDARRRCRRRAPGPQAAQARRTA